VRELPRTGAFKSRFPASVKQKSSEIVAISLRKEWWWGSRLLGFSGFLAFFPSAFGGLLYQALFNGTGRDTDITDLAIDDGFDSLQVGQKAPFRDGGHVHTDAALFLGFTTSPDDAALDRAFTG
jgi:hypothetical protein